MNPTLRHMQRILATLQDFGLSPESIHTPTFEDLTFEVIGGGSNLFMTPEQEYPLIVLEELRTVNEIRYQLELSGKETDILERVLERVDYSKADTIAREVVFYFEQGGLIREITLDGEIRKFDPQHYLGQEVLDRLYPWKVQQLYEELKDGNYSTMEKTDAAIDRLIETALSLDITRARPRSAQNIDEILKIIKETNGENKDAEIKNALKRIEDRLANANALSLLPEAEGLRQLYLQRINEGRFLLFQHYGLQFPYVLANNAELDGCSGRVVDRGLYFVAEDAAPELWQKEIIAYHEYIESRRGHAAAVRKEIGLARELGISKHVFYSWTNALRRR